MKFSWFDKLLLVVVLLLVIALAALCIGIAMSFVTADMAAHVTGIVTNGMTENRLIMGGPDNKRLLFVSLNLKISFAFQFYLPFIFYKTVRIANTGTGI